MYINVQYLSTFITSIIITAFVIHYLFSAASTGCPQEKLQLLTNTLINTTSAYSYITDSLLNDICCLWILNMKTSNKVSDSPIQGRTGNEKRLWTL